ncbi:hypothetical protein BD311DRAFT_648774 [Dichomitus squalens]|uniref:Uncharacterized protein n=1 Tax=Dichomitus squalens TaxID=114155 RepID=A0A4Q9QCB0_9APHY|nr:hypothetical protein BD311DRAFT_648774 [Dichomitus squalens]TBU64930.1 hypothetical protein BD310DRAFT_293195 [Dichomitus squalens]
MSSPTGRLSSHRRRSHSASSPIPRRQPDDVKWRISVKRSRPSSIRSPSYKDLAHDQPTEKWDVDSWRRGKRARRNINAEGSSDEGSCSNGLSSLDATSPTPHQSHASSPNSYGFACTSAAFQFFPQKPKPRRRASGPGRARLSREASPRAEGDRISSDEARRLRASALSELHRSVAESGEGLVYRMRDWEQSHLKVPRVPGSPFETEAPRRSWRPRPTSYYAVPQAATADTAQTEDEDDDVLIVGETSPVGIARSPAHKKRALSLSMMDVDLPEAHTSHSPGLGDSERSSSPLGRFSGPSAYSSDDEGHADMDTDLSSDIFSTPALSHTYSASTNSSLVSLPLPHQANEGSNGIISASASSITIVPGNARPTPPPTASRSEKAIAALTLAMANGAAGISDYEVLRMTEELATLDESHAGELWN